MARSPSRAAKPNKATAPRVPCDPHDSFREPLVRGVVIAAEIHDRVNELPIARLFGDTGVPDRGDVALGSVARPLPGFAQCWSDAQAGHGVELERSPALDVDRHVEDW